MANFKTNIKTTNYELNSEIRTLIDSKLSHLDKFLPVNKDQEVIVDVEVGKTTQHHNQGEVYRAEFNLKYSDQFKRSESTQESLEAAIEIASDELNRQVRRSKNKKTDLIRKGGKQIKKILRFGR
jgi:ribosomal subunit interface protein